MNKKVKLIIGLIVLILVIIAASFGYNYLSKNYMAEDNTDIKQNETQALQKAPDFTVFNKSKEKVNLSDNFGKPIIVNFWATWCGPCQSEMPAFDKLYKEYGDEIVFMMVNLTDGYRETIEKVDKFVAENKYEFPVYYDTEYSASMTYGVNSIPATFFINKKGEIVEGHIGAMNEDLIKSYINKLK